MERKVGTSRPKSVGDGFVFQQDNDPKCKLWVGYLEHRRVGRYFGKYNMAISESRYKPD